MFVDEMEQARAEMEDRIARMEGRRPEGKVGWASVDHALLAEISPDADEWTRTLSYLGLTEIDPKTSPSELRALLRCGTAALCSRAELEALRGRSRQLLGEWEEHLHGLDDFATSLELDVGELTSQVDQVRAR